MSAHRITVATAATASFRTARQPRPHALALACRSLLGLSGAALAQDASPTSLDALTVTADHRERNLQEVPVSVGVVQ
ncbi:hypothetical protein, partial [Stenotrophomonas sp. SrG]|uniref:hypothetical protein n=1 Tax=Stenotrophomonas sp. SrG TaxID=3414430 RepID=UPI003CEB5C4A